MMMTKAAALKPCVYVIDDDPEVRRALRWLFESVFLPVETFESAYDFLKDYDVNRRGCLVVDVRLPGMSGLEFLEQLKIKKNKMPVIMITGHGDIPMAVKAMKNGAKDFISKPFNDQYLLDQIHKLMTMDEEDHNKNNLEQFNKLTKRENEVMQLVVEGKLNKQIAVELGISKSTVELHRSRVMRKMKVKTLAQLIKINIIANEFISKS